MASLAPARARLPGLLSWTSRGLASLSTSICMAGVSVSMAISISISMLSARAARGRGPCSRCELSACYVDDGTSKRGHDPSTYLDRPGPISRLQPQSSLVYLGRRKAWPQFGAGNHPATEPCSSPPFRSPLDRTRGPRSKCPCRPFQIRALSIGAVGG
ncbi:hypothetical protein BGZ61DRAFT_451699 [Ilyonectria robusta]|uniref:uncharacterized protein n=1 Tax=Ilyonectria robusta TaxID=1079257 RepID=UPI001E8D4F5A|nr:uncharacterized protein BGZ61DRAFT_451699 [Ilyonectria robusta]KAH8699977.1 hypothetical protein BGZ61DRAFT_451699 [Ilyonectria robusta]